MNERWTIEQLAPLVEMALDLSGYNGQHSGRVRSLPDLRTIRYYTTLGLLDPPAEMRGRKAFYGRRHLVQLAAIKRLQSRGLVSGPGTTGVGRNSDAGLGRVGRATGRFLAACDRASRKQPMEAHPRADRAARAHSGPPNLRCRRRKPAEELPSPRLALHLPVIDGVELVLEGIDPARWTPEAIARLKGPLEGLARTLRDLKLRTRHAPPG